MPGVQYPQQPEGWGPSLGTQQPQPPPGFGGMPGADVSATGMTWTPSADGGGLLWDGKSWNHAAASGTNPAQLIESTKADVADAVAVRCALFGAWQATFGARQACVLVRSREGGIARSAFLVSGQCSCHGGAVLCCAVCASPTACRSHTGLGACTVSAARARRASAAARAPTARTATRSPRPASCATRRSCWALTATAAARPAAPSTRCASSKACWLDSAPGALSAVWQSSPCCSQSTSFKHGQHVPLLWRQLAW